LIQESGQPDGRAARTPRASPGAAAGRRRRLPPDSDRRDREVRLHCL